ncbi:hypothetical protein QYF61_022373 [Mycteria americana]|uniref:Uncharacterized protein n=1 Tax=Mycteria americana TaxID=33587 RepID=A0AAN7NL22_MYCAM|nr:hypothetical protein QYF61_022373 [Mycteria americana]
MSPLSLWKGSPPLPQQIHTPRKGSDCTGTAASALSCIASELHSNRIPATAVQEWYLLLENQWSGAVETAEMVGEKGRDVQLVPLICIWKRAGWHMSPARDGDSTTSLGSPSQCLTTLSVKKFFLISHLNLS